MTGFPIYLRWMVWIAYVAVWTVALLTPNPVAIAHAVLPHEAVFTTAKTLHICAYAMGVVLSGWLQVTSRFRWALLVFISVHAMGTEFLQQYVPTRTGSVRDVILDHIGIILGLILSWKWWWTRP
jgi:VanZ family protein